ncbi:extensin [Magnolia sinica]|uniref:extensin n=1 Tax=Magnolia sinica TaxID=86752 RepID=UPI002657FE8D|nr:extensin [Magnolia sinica]
MPQNLNTECMFSYGIDARSSRHFKAFQLHQSPTHQRTSTIKISKNLKPLKHFIINPNLLAESIDPNSLAESPNSFPPFDETMGPLSPTSLPLDAPPYCVYPPFTPLTPPTTVPSPVINPTPLLPPSPTTPTNPFESPPPIVNPSPPSYPPGPPGYYPSPPEYGPNPPTYVPNPPEYVPSPPTIYVPNPPGFVPGPPEFGPSPPEFVPTPPTFLPPIVFPPPFVPPPPPHTGTGGLTLWCVAKPSVPEPIMQEAMNYACGSGADCASILPNGPCYEPDTLYAHASYAFNSYWQRTKAGGGTCDFGGTAILVTKDPSFDGCHFMLS